MEKNKTVPAAGTPRRKVDKVKAKTYSHGGLME